MEVPAEHPDFQMLTRWLLMAFPCGFLHLGPSAVCPLSRLGKKREKPKANRLQKKNIEIQ